MKTFIKSIIFVFFFMASVATNEVVAQSRNKVEFVKENTNDLNNIKMPTAKKAEKPVMDVKKITKNVANYKSMNKMKQRKRLRFRSKRKAATKCYRETVCKDVKKKH